MRPTLLACSVLALTAATADAQTTYAGPWQPRPTIGVALGAFDYDVNNDRTNRLVSGTVEIPFTDEARLRIEAGRSAVRVPSDASLESYRFTGDARPLDDVRDLCRLVALFGGQLGQGVHDSPLLVLSDELARKRGAR